MPDENQKPEEQNQSAPTNNETADTSSEQAAISDSNATPEGNLKEVENSKNDISAQENMKKLQENEINFSGADLAADKVFIILSEREDINQDCMSVLSKLGLKCIVLNNPDEINSIAEIMAQYPKIEFALTILAGDDFIYDRLKGKPGNALLTPKANAVFLLGYVLAKFGNLGTLTIYKEQKSFRMPAGLQHTSFVPYQKGGVWEQILHSKLKQKQII